MYMIGNIGVMSTMPKGRMPFRERGGGEVHGPEHEAGGCEVDAAGVDDTMDFGAVPGEVALVHGDAKARDGSEAAGTGHVVKASLGVQVVAAAGASADGGAAAAVAIGKGVAAETDNRGTTHKDLRGVIGSG